MSLLFSPRVFLSPGMRLRYKLAHIRRLRCPFRKLIGHSSCVNALVFSRDGRFLVSGGDGAYPMSVCTAARFI